MWGTIILSSTTARPKKELLEEKKNCECIFENQVIVYYENPDLCYKRENQLCGVCINDIN